MKNESKEKKPRGSRKASNVAISSAEPGSAKTVVKDGKKLKQYPAAVGYHGTDDEAQLSPEE